jgi:ELWxxDGT repeat protein
LLLGVSDGTLAGTRHLRFPIPGHRLGQVFRFRGNDYITGWDQTNRAQVYRVLGFQLIEAWDFETGYSCKPVQVGSDLFFVNWTPQRGNELWKTDGTNAGKQMIADIFFGRTSGILPDCSYGWVVLGNKLIFMAQTLNNGVQLWASDGTKAGTVRLTSFSNELAVREGYISIKDEG